MAEVSGEEYGCAVDTHLWLYYSTCMKKSPPPFFFTDHQYCMLNETVKAKFGVDVHNGVNHTNWLHIYAYLKNNVSC